MNSSMFEDMDEQKSPLFSPTTSNAMASPLASAASPDWNGESFKSTKLPGKAFRTTSGSIIFRRTIPSVFQFNVRHEASLAKPFP